MKWVELYFLLNSCVQASIDTGEPWWLQLSRYLTIPRPNSAPYAKPVFMCVFNMHVEMYWLHRPRVENCSHRLSKISPSVQGFYRHNFLFSISENPSRWLHRNFETKLAPFTASCNQWILSDLVHNYIACYQHKAVKSSCIRGLLAFSLERLDWSSSMPSASSLTSNAKPPILSERQYLLCWLITFPIVSKQLSHGVKGPSRRGQGSPRREEVQAQMDSSTDVRLYPPLNKAPDKLSVGARCLVLCFAPFRGILICFLLWCFLLKHDSLKSCRFPRLHLCTEEELARRSCPHAAHYVIKSSHLY